MKVLHIYKDYYPVLGGIENHIRMLAEEQVKRGYRVTVLVTSPSLRTEREERNGVQVIKAGRLMTVASTPLSISLPFLLSHQNPDIAHLHFPYPLGELAYLLAGHSHNMVITYHSDIVRQKYLLHLYKPFLRRVLARADVITVSSPSYIQSSPFLSCLSYKCRAIPHGTDLGRFATTPSILSHAGEIRKSHAAPLILFVGVLRYYKGLSFLIEAMSQIQAKLLIVGQGPQGKEWQSLARRLGLDNKIFFLGRVSDEKLLALYHACDVFVLPSVHRSESWGAVQIEAMACGKPVISTELKTGTSFSNLHGKTGFVVPPGDPQALADAILTVLRDDKLRQEMGSCARERALQEFSLQTMVDRITKLYEEIIKEGSK
ncbi:MAG: glycosyltransferase [Proteobacteria bacterium]|nr:glycosyltransferase [Pseudomonadota bacterium]